MVLKTFGWSLALTVVGLAAGFAMGGISAFTIVAILVVLEVSLSFDNAVVNATILKRMNAFWQKIFLSVGILIAVFGMRLLFPLVIVALTAKIGLTDVVRLALKGGDVDTPGTYAHLLSGAHANIAAFGGMFLLMLFFDFLFEESEIEWLKWLEAPLARIGRLNHLPVVVALVVLCVVSQVLAHDPGTVLFAGVLGVLTYLLVTGLGELFEGIGGLDEPGSDEDAAVKPTAVGIGQASGKAAFFLFVYLEVLDASFSFDGVIGAFAITQDIFVIALGLGVGAMWIRSLTVYMVRQGALDEYAYLEHGAMWAIGALASILLISIRHEVPEIVTGLVGVGFIGAAFMSSVVRNRRMTIGK